MDSLAILLRSEQLVAHNFHNMTKGVAFFSDHEFFGEVYPELEGDYDAVVERCIGSGEDINLCDVTTQAAQKASAYDCSDMAADEMCAVLLGMERTLQAKCAELNKGASLGSQNLLQGISDRSEMRVYKLRQRIR